MAIVPHLVDSHRCIRGLIQNINSAFEVYYFKFGNREPINYNRKLHNIEMSLKRMNFTVDKEPNSAIRQSIIEVALASNA